MRYFFDVVDPVGETRDAEGVQLETLEQMRRKARWTLARIAADEPSQGDDLALSLRVRDEDGQEVYTLSLSIKGCTGSY